MNICTMFNSFASNANGDGTSRQVCRPWPYSAGIPGEGRTPYRNIRPWDDGAASGITRPFQKLGLCVLGHKGVIPTTCSPDSSGSARQAISRAGSAGRSTVGIDGKAPTWHGTVGNGVPNATGDGRRSSPWWSCGSSGRFSGSSS